MIPTFIPYCNCCRLPVARVTENDCPRCGYPIDAAKEERFLASSLLELDRVATFGGATLTVTQLIQRYRHRLKHLQEAQRLRIEQMQRPFEAPPRVSSPDIMAAAVSAEELSTPASVQRPPAPTRSFSAEELKPASHPQETPVPVQGPSVPTHSFSLGSFLEEQTITIVASLGAFLILIGSLSFIATTSNLMLSFLVLFVVHAVFGGVGILSYRFRSFRTVAAIYTTIFALLVPLVGFSAYRLVSGNVVQFSTPALVAIAAIYAALAYGALAVYQKFSPFGYLGVIALMVATLAIAAALHLGYWWWPGVLMLPALPAILSMPRYPGDVRPFVAPWTILREPLLAFMWMSVVVCIVSIPVVFGYTLLFLYGRGLVEARFALASMLVLLLCWNCLFVWRTTRTARPISYLFLLCALAFAYAFTFQQTGYVLVLTGVALLYHGVTRLAPRLMQTFKAIEVHLERLALLLVALVPLIVVPTLPILLLEKAYLQGYQRVQVVQGLPLTWDLLVGLAAILVGLMLTISIALKHTGVQKVPDAAARCWRWLLLLSSFLLNSAYGLFILLIYAQPVWWLLGLALALVAAAVVTRRFIGAMWGNALDVLALIEIGLTLLFSFNLGTGHILTLWLGIAVLLYAILLYQRRATAFIVPVILAVLILPVLLNRPQALLVASLVLPLAAAGIQRLITHRWNALHATLPGHKNTFWEWPLLLVGVIYGVLFGWHEIVLMNTQVVTTVESWLHIRFAVSLELAGIAVCWYIAAVLARVKWWTLLMMGFVVAALLIPGNPFWMLAWLAPVLALLSLGISLLAGKGWAIPLYGATLLTAIALGFAGHDQGQAGAWVLLLFAALVYLIGVIERAPGGLWVIPIFATWSVFYAGQSGDLYRSPSVALACAALGVGIGCLRFSVPKFSVSMLRRYAAPLYATACASAVLTGVSGMLGGVDRPFFAAIPTALFVYAIVAYGVVLFERSARWLVLVPAFAIWGILLLPQAAACLGTEAVSSACSVQGTSVLYYLTGIVFVAGIVSYLTGLIELRMQLAASKAIRIIPRARFSWNWSWYLVGFVALVRLLTWSHSVETWLPFDLLLYALIFLIGFTLLLTILERAPEMLLIPVALTVWTVAFIHWPLWQQMVACTLLSVLVFAAQFIWHVVKPETSLLSPKRLYQRLSIGGQVLIILIIIVNGGLTAAGGLLVPVGVGALLILAMLIFCVGLLDADKAVRRMCNYCAGLLCSLVISWEFSAFGLNQADVLTVAPAVYLVVITPFLARAQVLPNRQMWGRICSIVGALLLLLPILWISFSEGNLAPTLILAGEALGLLLLGIVTRIRIFVLSGAALTIVGAMHALFLPSLGIPTSLALSILGGTLLAIATGLSLTRRRLRMAWSEWV